MTACDFKMSPAFGPYCVIKMVHDDCINLIDIASVSCSEYGPHQRIHVYLQIIVLEALNAFSAVCWSQLEAQIERYTSQQENARDKSEGPAGSERLYARQNERRRECTTNTAESIVGGSNRGRPLGEQIHEQSLDSIKDSLRGESN